MNQLLEGSQQWPQQSTQNNPKNQSRKLSEQEKNPVATSQPLQRANPLVFTETNQDILQVQQMIQNQRQEAKGLSTQIKNGQESRQQEEPLKANQPITDQRENCKQRQPSGTVQSKAEETQRSKLELTEQKQCQQGNSNQSGQEEKVVIVDEINQNQETAITKQQSKVPHEEGEINKSQKSNKESIKDQQSNDQLQQKHKENETKFAEPISINILNPVLDKITQEVSNMKMKEPLGEEKQTHQRNDQEKRESLDQESCKSKPQQQIVTKKVEQTNSLPLEGDQNDEELSENEQLFLEEVIMNQKSSAAIAIETQPKKNEENIESQEITPQQLEKSKESIDKHNENSNEPELQEDSSNDQKSEHEIGKSNSDQKQQENSKIENQKLRGVSESEKKVEKKFQEQNEEQQQQLPNNLTEHSTKKQPQTQNSHYQPQHQQQPSLQEDTKSLMDQSIVDIQVAISFPQGKKAIATSVFMIDTLSEETNNNYYENNLLKTDEQKNYEELCSQVKILSTKSQVFHIGKNDNDQEEKEKEPSQEEKVEEGGVEREPKQRNQIQQNNSETDIQLLKNQSVTQIVDVSKRVDLQQEDYSKVEEDSQNEVQQTPHLTESIKNQQVNNNNKIEQSVKKIIHDESDTRVVLQQSPIQQQDQPIQQLQPKSLGHIKLQTENDEEQPLAINNEKITPNEENNHYPSGVLLRNPEQQYPQQQQQPQNVNVKVKANSQANAQANFNAQIVQFEEYKNTSEPVGNQIQKINPQNTSNQELEPLNKQLLKSQKQQQEPQIQPQAQTLPKSPTPHQQSQQSQPEPQPKSKTLQVIPLNPSERQTKTLRNNSIHTLVVDLHKSEQNHHNLPQLRPNHYPKNKSSKPMPNMKRLDHNITLESNLINLTVGEILMEKEQGKRKDQVKEMLLQQIEQLKKQIEYYEREEKKSTHVNYPQSYRENNWMDRGIQNQQEHPFINNHLDYYQVQSSRVERLQQELNSIQRQQQKEPYYYQQQQQDSPHEQQMAQKSDLNSNTTPMKDSRFSELMAFGEKHNSFQKIYLASSDQQYAHAADQHPHQHQQLPFRTKSFKKPLLDRSKVAGSIINLKDQQQEEQILLQDQQTDNKAAEQQQSQQLQEIVPNTYIRSFDLKSITEMQNWRDILTAINENLVSLKDMGLNQHPTAQNSQSQLVSMAHKAFLKFGTNIQNPDILLNIKKYKNCILLSISEQKNIIWHYDGKLYYGGWIDGIKNDWGFESNQKYTYKGQFKNKRQGQGMVKILSDKVTTHAHTHSNDQEQSDDIKNKDSKSLIEKNYIYYIGEWNKNHRQGMGIQLEFTQNHVIEYRGQWSQNKKNGHGTLKIIHQQTDKLQQQYEGTFEEGLKSGHGKEKFPNGDQYEGSYKGNKFNGEGKYCWKNGSIYKGHFKDGMRHGYGEWVSQMVSQQSQNVKDDKEGTCVCDTYQGYYENDKKNGRGVYKWKNGTIYEGTFLNDLKHGEGVIYYEGGKKVKHQWENGEIVQKRPTSRTNVIKHQQQHNLPNLTSSAAQSGRKSSAKKITENSNANEKSFSTSKPAGGSIHSKHAPHRSLRRPMTSDKSRKNSITINKSSMDNSQEVNKNKSGKTFGRILHQEGFKDKNYKKFDNLRNRKPTAELSKNDISLINPEKIEKAWFAESNEITN